MSDPRTTHVAGPVDQRYAYLYASGMVPSPLAETIKVTDHATVELVDIRRPPEPPAPKPPLSTRARGAGRDFVLASTVLKAIKALWEIGKAVWDAIAACFLDHPEQLAHADAGTVLNLQRRR